jgi:acyl transferase domain-containing protein/acyl carrier protein
VSEFFDRISQLPPKRLALLALELQEKLERAERRFVEPVAVVGVGCRFPGASNPAAFWKLLHDGVDAIREVPKDRWDVDEYYSADPGASGRMCTRHGGFLDRIDEFDAGFFGIAPREATAMDPQQRLLLEVSWEALEHAGQAPDRLDGSRTAVFVGISSIDFAQLLLSGATESLDVYTASGASHAIASGRLSYVLGLRGPSVSIDTACSSSLVAVHLACQSLRAQECRMALAAGVNLMIAPDTTISLSKAGMLAPDGRCKTFDASADGFARGEGCGVLVLKRLSDARRDGDRILAVLRGTAVNQDGRSSGLTAPNGPAQEAVLREAIEKSGLTPADVSYVETHGTGTVLGDPIEIRALAAVLGERTGRAPLVIGSVKTNFGHLEAAAGVAGLIKTVLALDREEIPPHLHFETPNPHIEWTQLPLDVPRELRPWPISATPRVAGVSSLGFSGTNAHVIVEEAPRDAIVSAGPDRPLHLLTLSAKSALALRELADRYARAFAAPDVRAADLCYTANVGRASFSHRLTVTGATAEDFNRTLIAVAAGESRAEAQTGVVESSDPPEVAFLFTGQGSQYLGMGRELLDKEPAFRSAFDRCDAILEPVLGRSLRSFIFADDGDDAAALDDTRITQPALFAIEYALAELWQSWGVRPSAVIGHSLGEYVAAAVSGVFTLEDALRLVVERARLMSALPAGGGMAAVFAEPERAAAAIAAYPRTLSIAAVNGPAHVVLSGVATDLHEVVARFTADGVKCSTLRVSHAFHSPLMEPMLAELEARGAAAVHKTPRIPLVSNLTGRAFEPGEPDARYWRRHAREPVRFLSGMQAVRALGCTAFVEIGPHPVLLGMGRECVSDGDRLRWLPSLRRGENEYKRLFASLGSLWALGGQVDWQGFDRPFARRKADAPTYPFQRQRYWPAHTPRRPGSGAGPRDDWREWLYETRWEPAEAISGSAARDTSGSPGSIAKAVEPETPALVAQHGIAVYDRLYPELDRTCAAYMVVALSKLGWRARAGDRVTVDGLLKDLRIEGRHRPLVARMLDVFVEDGLLRLDGDHWTVITSVEPMDAHGMMAEMRRRFPECGGELSLTARCAGQLAEVLRGECDPMQLLFPDGSLAEAEALYQHAPAFRLFNTLLARACARAAAAWPVGRTLQILEIGGGTGGTTAYVLPELAGRRVRYHFTDISPLFTARARSKFIAYDFVEYRPLDIERDPAAQGFAAGQFDIIVASNVLHATADLRKALGRVRDLLAPGGLLMLLEGTALQRFGDLTVGLTEGWWRFADDVRSGYALLSADRWIAVLEEMGFASAVALPDRSKATESLFRNQSIIVADAPPARQPSRPVAAQRTVVLVGRNDALDERQAEAFSNAGLAVVRVRHQTEWASLDAQTYGLDTERADHLQRFFATLGAAGNSATVAVVRGLDRQGGGDGGAQTVARAEASSRTALAVVQALTSGAVTNPPRLVFVTRGAHALDGRDPAPDPAQGPLWGFGRVVALEHPEFAPALVDLDPAARDDLADLAAVMAHPQAEDQILIRDGQSFGLRLARAGSRDVSSPPVAFGPGTYLVTGGLAGLGLAVAEWMAARGARRLVLMGRRGPTDSAQAAIDRLRGAGVEVTIALGDVASRSRLQEIVGSIDAGAPLRGVMHSAGITDDAALVQMTWEQFARVMSAKVQGSWNLHEVTAGLELDHFVLFSSGASMLGSRGQANHAAANAFMDALAHYRRAGNLPALSVNWGAWSEIGAATRGGVVERVETQGVRRIEPAAGLAALDHLIGVHASQTAVFPIVWPEFLKHALPPHRTLCEAFVSAQPGGDTAVAHVAVLDELRTASPARARSLLLTAVEREAVKILGLDHTTGIDPRRPLSELGLDSLMAVELRTALGALVARPQPATLLFNYPTVGELVDYLAADFIGGASAADERAADAGEAAAGEPMELDDLSEDELATLLASKLVDPRGSKQ